MTDQRSLPTTPHRQAWCDILLILLIFFIDGGAAAPHVNESHYLTKAKHFWDASYAPGDMFLDSADPHVAFYWTVGWMTTLLPLSAVAWLGRVAAWLLLAVGWQRLSASIVRAPWAAPLGAAIWVALLRDGAGNFAGEWVVGGVEAKCFAYGFFLLGMADLVRGEWRRPWIWFGAASAFHVLVGAWAVVTAGGVWLTEPRTLRTPLKSLLTGLALGGALSLIGLAPSLALEWHTDPAVNAEAAKIYVYDRLPHHLAPLTLPSAELRRRVAWLGGMTLLFAGLWAWSTWRSRLTPAAAAQPLDATIIDAPAAARLQRFAAFALAFALVGLAISAALDDNRIAAARVLRYYWFRQVDVALPLAIGIVGSGLVVVLLRRRHWLTNIAAIIPIVAAACFLANIAWGRWESNAPPALSHVDDPANWQEACGWVEANAPADARFLIPRWGHSFRWYASRADVANHKDVPQDAAGVAEWRARCRELFPSIESRDERGRKMMLDSPELLGTPRVLELAKKYHASHVIARSQPPLNLPVLFRSDDGGVGYTVYETGVPATPPSP